LEISCERARKQVLDQINYTKTCILARELCLILRTNRAVLEKQDVHEWCSFIARLCKEAGCIGPSELCAKAVEIVVQSEEKYPGTLHVKLQEMRRTKTTEKAIH